MNIETKELIEAKKKSVEGWRKVAIIILNWNGWKDTLECLESVFRNTYPNYQVIVIDNGSTDGSIEKIKAWADGKQEVLTPEPTHPLYYLSHPPVKKPIPYIYYTREEAEKGGNFKLEEKLTEEWQEQRKPNYKELNPTSSYPLILIQTGENLGFAVGNNVGIKYAMTKDNFDYIWLLNNDTVMNKDALTQLINNIKSCSGVGVVGSKLLKYHKYNFIQTTGGGRIFPWIGIEKGIAVNQEDKGQWDKEIILDYITGASFLTKTDVVHHVGLIDEKFFLYWEDADWCERIKIKGYQLNYAYKSKIWHKETATIGIRSPVQDYYGTKNALIFMERYYKKYWVLGALISFIGKILNRIMRNNYTGLRYIIKAYVDFFYKKER